MSACVTFYKLKEMILHVHGPTSPHESLNQADETMPSPDIKCPRDLLISFHKIV